MTGKNRILRCVTCIAIQVQIVKHKALLITCVVINSDIKPILQMLMGGGSRWSPRQGYVVFNKMKTFLTLYLLSRDAVTKPSFESSDWEISDMIRWLGHYRSVHITLNWVLFDICPSVKLPRSVTWLSSINLIKLLSGWPFRLLGSAWKNCSTRAKMLSKI